jgi:hypothetical protein
MGSKDSNHASGSLSLFYGGTDRQGDMNGKKGEMCGCWLASLRSAKLYDLAMFDKERFV